MFSCTIAQHIYCTNCTVWNWTVLTVITLKLLLHVQLHNSTTHLLYKLYKLYSLQLNCTYSNYAQAAARCSAAQRHTNCQADVFCSAIQPVWYFMCIYRKSYPMIRSFKQIQLTVNPPPQLPSATHHKLCSCQATACGAYITCSSVLIRWRNSGNVLHPTCRSGTSTLPVWLNAHAASAFLCLLPPRNHSHLAISYTVMQKPLVAPQTIISTSPSNLLRGEWVEWCGAISSWCFICCAWVTHSDKSGNGDYSTGCYKGNWLTHCANWRPS